MPSSVGHFCDPQGQVWRLQGPDLQAYCVIPGILFTSEYTGVCDLVVPKQLWPSRTEKSQVGSHWTALCLCPGWGWQLQWAEKVPLDTLNVKGRSSPHNQIKVSWEV